MACYRLTRGMAGYRAQIRKLLSPDSLAPIATNFSINRFNECAELVLAGWGEHHLAFIPVVILNNERQRQGDFAHADLLTIISSRLHLHLVSIS